MSTFLPPNLLTRRLSMADAEPVGAFFERLQADAETTRFFHPHPLTRSFAVDLCARQATCRDRAYATRYGDRIVAYSMLRGWDEGYAVPSFGGCTHPELRGAGLGHLLLAHAIAESRVAGAERLRLTVYKENGRAIHVYRTYGFVFSDKNEHELIGLLDLRAAPSTNLRTADRGKLDAWLQQQPNPQQAAAPLWKRSA